jgi:hypothetical protein
LHEEHDMKEIDANQWQEVQGGRSWSTSTHASRWHAGPGAADAPADLAGEPSATRSEETHRAPWQLAAGAGAHGSSGASGGTAHPRLPWAPGTRAGLLLIELPEQDKLGTA